MEDIFIDTYVCVHACLMYTLIIVVCLQAKSSNQKCAAVKGKEMNSWQLLKREKKLQLDLKSNCKRKKGSESKENNTYPYCPSVLSPALKVEMDSQIDNVYITNDCICITVPTIAS